MIRTIVGALCVFAAGLSLQAEESAPALAPASASTPASQSVPPSAPPRVLGLVDAVRLAHAQGRERKTRDEELRLTALSLAKVVGDYGPQPEVSATAGWTGTGAERKPGNDQSVTASVSQSLPTGGNVSVAATTARVRPSDNGAVTTPNTGTITLTQPLMRNFGPLVWRESLTAAERNLLYSKRSHILYLQGLSTSVAATYWGIQRNQAGVISAQGNLESATFTFEQSQAVMQIGKANANDVFRAETSMLAARQTLIDEQAGLAAAIDAFKLQLSIDLRDAITVSPAERTLTLRRIDLPRALDCALVNRLDLMTVHDQVEDARRAILLARRALLPDLDATASSTWNGVADEGARHQIASPPEWRVAVTLRLPLNRRNEELAYQNALIGLTRAQRAEDEARQRIIKEVQDAARRIRSAEASLTLQERNRIQAARRLEKANLDFQAGAIPNRDVVEAQNGVRDADNAWNDAVVAYRNADLGLRSATGALVINPDGTWDDSPPPYVISGDADQPVPGAK